MTPKPPPLGGGSIHDDLADLKHRAYIVAKDSKDSTSLVEAMVCSMCVNGHHRRHGRPT